MSRTNKTWGGIFTKRKKAKKANQAKKKEKKEKKNMGSQQMELQMSRR